MATSEGRQRLRQAESQEEAAREAEQPAAKPEEVLRAPPLEVRGEEEWRLAGIYTHQVLKAGLRHLDETWPVLDLFEFPRGGLLDAGRGLKMENLLRQLLTGSLQLKSVPASDVAAAQYDLRRLSLRQLLKIRVQHLEFTPSGRGCDSISSVGSRHEAFMETLDGRLFKLLGEKAVGDLARGGDDLHRFGREAVLFAAASVGLPPSPVRRWCWCLDESRRAFFDVATFRSGGFPAEGVLEVVDLSKRDPHEPTGRLQWFDWRVTVARDEAALVAKPLALGCAAAAGAAGGDEEAGFAFVEQDSPVRAGTSAIAAAGLGFDATKLQDLRGNLRQVRGPDGMRYPG